MFNGCTSLNYIELKNMTSWNATTSWVANVASSGTFVCPSELGDNDTIKRGISYCPNNWSVGNCWGLCFTAKEANSTISMQSVGTAIPVSLETSTDDGKTWMPFVVGTTTITLASAGDQVYFRAGNEGTGGTGVNLKFATSESRYTKFVMTGKVAVSGDISSILDSSGTVSSFAAAGPLAARSYVFDHLFYGCTSLVSARYLLLPATTLAVYCYEDMFSGCTNLVDAPWLPSGSLNAGCYYGMFRNCAALAEAPELPATALKAECYNYMFRNCTSLVDAPYLPAETLTEDCYSYMFAGCSSLNNVNVAFTSWSSSCTYNWLQDVSATGSFQCPHALGDDSTITRGPSNCPTGWNVYNYWGLCFTAEEANSTISMQAIGDAPSVSLQTSIDGVNWTPFTVGTTTITLANVGDKVYFAAGENNNTRFGSSTSAYNTFIMTGKVAAYGSITSLLNAVSKLTSLSSSYCYCYLFNNCTSLTFAPELPATTLASYCYYGMFYGCTSLIQAPALPATTLTGSCYASMFNGCSSLTTAPTLPAMTLAQACYTSMFYGC